MLEVTTMDTLQRALGLLRRALGPDAKFRADQDQAIKALVDDHARLIVVQRTGWGKSFVYFLSAFLLRERGAGPTLIISPLLSLMADQRLMADRLGLRTETINSGNKEDWDFIERDLEHDRIDVLFITPERLANPRFVQRTLPGMPRGIGMLVIDEAHCVSDWGHDFRPDYRRIVRIAERIPATVPLLATTATANDRVINDIRAQLGDPIDVLRGALARPTLRLQAISLPDPAQRLAWLAQHLPKLPGSGIVFTLTTTDADLVARWLQQNGINARAYHSKIGADDGLQSDQQAALKRQWEDALRHNRVKALVATVALGMGFDKPDLGFVVHYQRPGSVVAYYQQVGRAGRAVDEALVILLDGREDDAIQDWFIESAFPTLQEQELIVGALEASKVGEMTTGDIQAAVNVSKQRIDNGLKYLEIDGVVAKDGSRWSRTVVPWKPDTTHADGITALRRTEQQRMREFVRHNGCLMEFVARDLDDPHARPCGVCANCTGESLVPLDVDQAMVVRAKAFLYCADVLIKPRVMLPSGAFPEISPRTIREELRCSPGRALCTYGDGGWGDLVIAGKYSTGRFADDLVAAAAELIRNRWRPSPYPAWVTSVTSLRTPGLVSDFAARLADTLGIPYVNVIAKIRETKPQKQMQNSVQQAENIGRAFAVDPAMVRPGPVLLVDDIIDSGWTMTTLGSRLRRAGSGPVYPFALAKMKQQASDP